MLPKRHLKLENILMQNREHSGLSGELFAMMPRYETQSQFGKVEKGRLNESLLYECANFPGNLFTVMTSRVGGYTHK